MKRSRGLEALRQLAEFAADAASRTVAERMQAVRAGEERLGQLERYVADYAQLATQPGTGSVANLRARRRFLERLQAAAGEQRDEVERQEQQFQAALEQWRDERARALALARYAERLAQEHRDVQERRAQARLDEVGRDGHRRQSRS